MTNEEILNTPELRKLKLEIDQSLLSIKLADINRQIWENEKAIRQCMFDIALQKCVNSGAAIMENQST